MTRPLQVFLCHASQDKPEVWKLHRYLKTRGVKPWLDVEDLLPGEDWEVEIPKALFSSDIILVCLSKNSVNKEGYVQKEIAFALDKALEKPEGTIFIIPVKLEDCELPKRLSRYQAVDLFRTDGRKRLLMGLNKRIANLGEEVLPITIEETRQRTPKPIKPETKPDEKFIAPQFEIKEEKPLVEETKEKAKPFTRVLNPSVLASQRPKQINKDKQSNIFRRIFLGGFIFLGLLTVFMAGNLIFENFLLVPTSTQTVSSVTPKPLTLTATATKSLAVSTTTRLDIGSTTIGNDGMVLMYIPAGEFTMGSDVTRNEQPAHKVYLDSFWADQTEVTNEMYAKCVRANQCNPPSNFSSNTRSSYYNNSEFDDFPVIYVSWNDAKSYCEWAGRRLLTEAEWEKSARGNDERNYPWGNVDPKENLLNYKDNIGDTNKVGSYPLGKSIYGLLDTAGNVFEWVNDWYDEKYYKTSPLSNPNGPVSGEYRVMRGSAWDNYSYDSIRSARRYWNSPLATLNNLGFRCAMDADQ